MAGVLPAIARLLPVPLAPSPVEVTFARGNWLADEGARLRGYRNTTWRFEPATASAGLVAEDEHRFDLVGSHHAVGSLIHLDFAAQPQFLRHFFQRHHRQPNPVDPWAAVP